MAVARKIKTLLTVNILVFVGIILFSVYCRLQDRSEALVQVVRGADRRMRNRLSKASALADREAILQRLDHLEEVVYNQLNGEPRMPRDGREEGSCVRTLLCPGVAAHTHPTISSRVQSRSYSGSCRGNTGGSRKSGRPSLAEGSNRVTVPSTPPVNTWELSPASPTMTPNLLPKRSRTSQGRASKARQEGSEGLRQCPDPP